MSAPLPAEEAQRLEALHRYEVLDTSPEAAFDRITTLAARLFAVPVALVTLLDVDRQWFKSVRGLEICETSRDVAFCNYTILGDEVLVVPDATLDARFADNPLVSGPSHLRFYAGAPLRTADGHRLGSLCLVDIRPRPAGLDADGQATLADLAAMVVDELELRLASRRAREVAQERQRKEAQIAAYARQQSAIARFGLRALESAESGLNALLAEAADLVATTLGADFSTVFEHLSGHGVLIRRAGHGWPEGAFNRLETGVAANRQTASGYAFLTGRPVVSADIHRETRFKLSPYAQQHGAVAIANVIIARAASSDGSAPAPFGVLNVLFCQAHVFSDEEVAFLQAVANILATAIARQRAETTIQHAREEAERANVAKSEFLSRMSHELRTPMNAILGFGQLLEMDELSERQTESVNHILAAGRHLLNLINELLDTERIESGRLELNLEPVAVREAVGEVLALIKPTAAPRGVTFKDHVEGETGMVLADRQRLRQVLINLLSNAVKYNREHGTVDITCTGVPTHGEDGVAERVRLTVRDSGPGITPENLGRLFTPFERLDAAHRRIEGTGIGLALSKRLTEAMGGRIGVESAVGWGSAFFIELPLTSAVAGLDTDAEEGVAEAADPPEGEEGARRVLYVEDNPANLRLVEQVLTHRPGLRLLSAQEGVAGLELARRWQPDLILLDLHLPDLPGDVILRALRADERTGAIPVIILSADSTASQVKRLRAAGANDYLTKPLQVPEFLRVLDDRLGVLAAG